MTLEPAAEKQQQCRDDARVEQGGEQERLVHGMPPWLVLRLNDGGPFHVGETLIVRHGPRKVVGSGVASTKSTSPSNPRPAPLRRRFDEARLSH